MRVGLFLAIALALVAHTAFAKSRLTDPVKVARDCKDEVELYCKEVRPGSQRITGCLKAKAPQLSPACTATLKSTE